MRGVTVIMEHLLPTGRDTCGDVSIFIHRAIIDGPWPKKYSFCICTTAVAIEYGALSSIY